ncbi:hypothetical protein [Chryseosolibacter indicus]|uniref:YtxH domain-containing protein n=1 Tax=Chryseosolibacter indicus TaxID=2782351 RepID=A0ABS5VPK8_9BACT|nr:hypothetical protein [Chryseosolibacter indicus]MBT1703353.1 hypothetical protein [Chryseosolibacter indicus]
MGKGKGKKKNKSFYKRNVEPVIPDNKILLAALGGVAAGITLAGIFGTDKAKQIVQSVEDSVKEISDRIKGGLNGSDAEADYKFKRKNSLEKV